MKAPNGEYLPATPKDGAIIVLVGDLVQKWTADKFVACVSSWSCDHFHLLRDCSEPPLPTAISGVLGSGIGNGSMLNASSFFNRITELLFLKTQGTVATDEWSYFSTIQTMTPSSSAWMGPISTQNFPPRNISTKWKTTSSRIRTCVEHPALDLTWPLIIFGRITVRVLGLLVLPIKIWHVTI